jgi:UDP-N-acetyl-D-mannosaminuronic acid dehydrogenase
MTGAMFDYDVAVIGLGYVGMPAFLMLANAGLKVAGVDTDSRKLELLHKGKMPLDDEPGFDVLFDQVRSKSSNIHVSSEVPSAAAYMIAVPTPLKHGRHTADVSYVDAALKAISPKVREGSLVIINSTCPPLTCAELAVPILEKSGLKVGQDILLAYCPERLYPGNIVYEIVHNDHIIGGIDAASTKAAKKLYEHFVKGELIETDALTAEFCKLVENTFRDVNIALANELAAVSERLGTDINTVIEITNKHPRVSVLSPGIGVGGHCLPIDPWFLVEQCPLDTHLIATARRINDARPSVIAGKIRKIVAGHHNKRIGLFGLTYKPDVNDMRESPATQIRDVMVDDGYNILAYDPVAKLGSFNSVADFGSSCDIVFVLVKHGVFAAEIDQFCKSEPDKWHDMSRG